MTHAVTNQPPPLIDYDAAAIDTALQDVLVPAGIELGQLGRLVGSPQVQRWAVEANTYSPVLRTHDRYGHRVDEVDFHPSWHALLDVAVGHGLQGAPWVSVDRRPHLRRAAAFYVWSQAEAGHGCPISMSYAVVPALRTQPDLAAEPGPRPEHREGAGPEHALRIEPGGHHRATWDGRHHGRRTRLDCLVQTSLFNPNFGLCDVVVVQIIARRTLRLFWNGNPEAETPLRTWYAMVMPPGGPVQPTSRRCSGPPTSSRTTA